VTYPSSDPARDPLLQADLAVVREANTVHGQNITALGQDGAWVTPAMLAMLNAIPSAGRLAARVIEADLAIARLRQSLEAAGVHPATVAAIIRG
jgi:hypothetical protein